MICAVRCPAVNLMQGMDYSVFLQGFQSHYSADHVMHSLSCAALSVNHSSSWTAGLSGCLIHVQSGHVQGIMLQQDQQCERQNLWSRHAHFFYDSTMKRTCILTKEAHLMVNLCISVTYPEIFNQRLPNNIPDAFHSRIQIQWIISNLSKSSIDSDTCLFFQHNLSFMPSH